MTVLRSTTFQLHVKNEDGTTKMRTFTRAVSDADEMLVTTQPRPFITTAVYKSWDAAEKAFRDSFNQQYERLVK